MPAQSLRRLRSKVVGSSSCTHLTMASRRSLPHGTKSSPRSSRHLRSTFSSPSAAPALPPSHCRHARASPLPPARRRRITTCWEACAKGSRAPSPPDARAPPTPAPLRPVVVHPRRDPRHRSTAPTRGGAGDGSAESIHELRAFRPASAHTAIRRTRCAIQQKFVKLGERGVHKLFFSQGKSAGVKEG